MWAYHVQDVELDGLVFPGVGDLEEEPLSVAIAVDVPREKEIIFTLVFLRTKA